MTELLHDTDAPSDAELISRVRGGDVAAYGELFSRHVDAARRLARQLVRGPDSDDLVSDAFAKVLSVLQGGGGPDVAFRAYLLTAVRRLHVDRIRAGAKVQASDDLDSFDPGVPFQDTAVAAFESGAAAKAFASLPERWQLVLWHLEVEGQKPADVAPLLGMSPNSVSALAYRAREGLRQAFLTMHLSDISEADCRWVNEHLGAYVRNGLAKRDATKVRGHLDGCRRCTAMYLELTEVNSDLRGIIAPLLLGAAAAGYLASSGAAGGGLGLMALIGRARDAVTANAGVATAGAVAAGVAAAAVAGIMLLPSSGPGDDVVGADEPIGVVSTPGDPGAGDGPGKDGPTTQGPDEVSPSELPGEEPLPGVVPAADGSPGADGSSQGTTEPTPTEPTPTEPSPTEPSPTEPSPTDPPPPVSYDIQVGPAVISDGRVSFDFTTDPVPPTVYLRIESSPAGVTFAPTGGTCAVRVGGLTAECDLAPDASPLLAPLARVVAAAAGDPFHVSMPLAGEPPVDTLVTVTLSAPEDTQRRTVTTLYDVAEPRPTADVALSPLTLTGHTVDAVGTDTFSFTTSVSGIPADVRSVTLGLTGARFGSSGTADCTVAGDGSTLTCDTTGLGGDPLAVAFTVVTASDEPSTLALSVSSPAGYDDPPANNLVGTTVEPTPETTIGLQDVVPAAVSPDDAGRYQLGVPVVRIPGGADEVTLSLLGDAAVVGSGASCEVEDERTVTCATGGATELTADLVLEPAGGSALPLAVSFGLADVPGYVDLTGDDDSVGATLLAPEPTADVALALPASVPATGALDYAFTATVSGLPEGYSGPVTLSIVGTVPPGEAELVSGDGCEVSDDGSSLACAEVPADGQIPLTVRVKNNNAATVVTMSVSPALGYVDPDSSDNIAEVTLEAFRPADASVTAVVDDQGNSGKAEVTATVAVDDPTAEVLLTVAYDQQIAPVPAGCTAQGEVVECADAAGSSYTFVVDVGRIRDEPRAGDVTFSVSVREPHRAVNLGDDRVTVTVARFAESVSSYATPAAAVDGLTSEPAADGGLLQQVQTAAAVGPLAPQEGKKRRPGKPGKQANAAPGLDDPVGGAPGGLPNLP